MQHSRFPTDDIWAISIAVGKEMDASACCADNKQAVDEEADHEEQQTTNKEGSQ